MQVWEFEEKVWQREGIRIVVRAPASTVVGNYDWEKAAESGLRVSQLVNGRIKSKLSDLEVAVIDGGGIQPNGNTRLKTIRDSYPKT